MHKLISILALSVLLLAVLRFIEGWRTAQIKTFSHAKNDAVFDKNLNPRSSSASFKRYLRLHRSIDQQLIGALKYGEGVLVFQQTPIGHRCFFGYYKYLGMRNDLTQLAPLTLSRSSKLVHWAAVNGLQVNWSLMLPRHNERPVPFVPACDRWFPSSRAQQELHLIAKGGHVFLASIEFSHVEAIVRHTERLKISENLLRGGWDIKASPGAHGLIVQSAKTGLRHKLKLYSTGGMKNIRGAKAQRKHRDLHKSFGVPGWD